MPGTLVGTKRAASRSAPVDLILPEWLQRWRIRWTPAEPSLEAFVAGQHRRDQWVYLLLGHYFRREGTITWRRLGALTRFTGLRSAELRVYVMELVGAGFVEPIFPGYQRRGTSYRWLLTAGPSEPAPFNPEPPPLAA